MVMKRRFAVNSLKPRILCVDDDSGILSFFEEALVPNGYEVILSDNGRDAWECIKKHSIDLVLLDIVMPGISGYDVCKKIREDKKYENIPVVMVTALQSTEDRIKSIDMGAADFITKPFDYEDILSRIKMLLKKEGHS